MPRKKKQLNSERYSTADAYEEKHLYVEAKVPPGHDVPIFDVYIGTTTEDFEEKIRRKLLESEYQLRQYEKTPPEQNE